MRKVSTLTILCFLTCSIAAYAAPGDFIWAHTYGGDYADMGESVRQTTDGGYIITGWTNIQDWSSQLYLVKTNHNGDTLWTRNFGGIETDNGYSVLQTSDGGYLATGSTRSFGSGSSDIFLVKVDSLGDSVWIKTCGSTGSEYGYSIQETDDGGYIIAGTKGNDVYLVKTDSIGDSLWTRTYGGNEGYSGRQTTDGGYIITGYIDLPEPNFRDVYLVKTDSLGDTLWTRTYGGPDNDEGNCVRQTIDGGYVITGYTMAFTPYYSEVLLLKTDSLGNVMWTQHYGDGANFNEMGYSVQQAFDGGYIIGGNTESFGAGMYDLYLIRTNYLGDTMWTRTFGGPNHDYGRSVIQNTDGDFLIAGSKTVSSADAYLVKVEGGGNLCLDCNITSYSPRVPNEDGSIIWDLTVENCGAEASDVYGELYPILGDCASGTQLDYDLIRFIASNLGPGNSSTHNYHYNPGTVQGVLDAAISIHVGPEEDNYTGYCCFEFMFAYEFGRPGTEIVFGPGEWEEGDNEVVIPTIAGLNQNYPNPFNASTAITFNIVRTGDVNLSVYNLAGQEVETPVDGKIQAGESIITWDASTYSSGIYFYKLSTDGKTFTKRMTLLK